VIRTVSWLVACAAALGTADVGRARDTGVRESRTDVSAATLLVVRSTDDALDFVDPGSGLRLASVPVGIGPRQVSVAPDGKLAAVSNCGPSVSIGEPGVSLSVVDLEHPHEVRRIALAVQACPAAVTWFAADRIAVAAEAAQEPLLVEASTGRLVHEIADLTAIDATARRQDAQRNAASTMLAVQQFMAAGGDPNGLATTPVLPRAQCHACTPDP